jgi:CDGSH-type Zn-finger protein
MPEIQIRALKDGPSEVKGPIQLLDSKGVTFKLTEDPIDLCRCADNLRTKPFCDGRHKRVGFKSEVSAR